MKLDLRLKFKNSLALGFVVLTLALATSCNKPEAQLQKAKRLAAAGQFQDAIDIEKKLVDSGQGQPWLSQAWLEMARSQKALQQLNDAKISAESALESAQKSSDRFDALLLMAEIQIALKDFDGAEKSLEDTGRDKESDPKRTAVAADLAKAQGASPLLKASEFVGLDATRMMVGRVDKVKSKLDPNTFPYVQRFVEKGKDTKILSPDGKRYLWRGLAKDGYFLYISDSDGKNAMKLKDCKNAFQPSWAPDSQRIVFSSMNWKTKERSLMIYDLNGGKLRDYFKSKRGVGAMAAFSTDGSKIAFVYAGDLWMLNANGIGLCKVNLKDQIKSRVKEADLLAWSRDGSQLAYRPKDFNETVVINFVRRAS